MAPSIKDGPYTWEGERDTEGHRTYKLTWRVCCSSSGDGPATVMQTPGLPLPGSIWVFDNDIDIWAWCLPNLRVLPELEGEPNKWWRVEQTFSTRPPDVTKQRCNDFQIEDPILEPPKISGGNNNDKVEATHDRFGFPILNSAHEIMKGSQVEFDQGRDVIRVEQNLSLLALTQSAPIRNTVNAFPIWGFPRRAVKLSTVTWERKFYGNCYVYYTRTLEFEALMRYNPITGTIEGGWDRDLVDVAGKVLAGEWDEDGDWVVRNIDGAPANPHNPTHFINAVGRDNKPWKSIILNGAGVPAYTIVGTNQRYLAIAASTGVPLHNVDKWLPLLSIDDSTEWNSVQKFKRGMLVNHTSGGPAITYALRKDDVGTEPGFDAATWVTLGPTPYTFVESGFYDDAQAYVLGNLVRDGALTGAGFRHVEKYPEADFLLLGIPIVF